MIKQPRDWTLVVVKGRLSVICCHSMAMKSHATPRFFMPTVQYDFIVCCEIAEHFANPAAEFQRLARLLKPGGRIYCMTMMWLGGDFSRWQYKNDPTHVFFYTPKSLAFIRDQYGFKSVKKR